MAIIAPSWRNTAVSTPTGRIEKIRKFSETTFGKTCISCPQHSKLLIIKVFSPFGSSLPCVCGLREGERRQRAVRSQEEGGGRGYMENIKNMNDVCLVNNKRCGGAMSGLA